MLLKKDRLDRESKVQFQNGFVDFWFGLGSSIKTIKLDGITYSHNQIIPTIKGCLTHYNDEQIFALECPELYSLYSNPERFCQKFDSQNRMTRISKLRACNELYPPQESEKPIRKTYNPLELFEVVELILAGQSEISSITQKRLVNRLLHLQILHPQKIEEIKEIVGEQRYCEVLFKLKQYKPKKLKF